MLSTKQEFIAARSTDISSYINNYIYALENSLVRIKYYEQTNEDRFLSESNEWLDVANIYLKEINKC